MYPILKFFLFKLNPEHAHEFTTHWLKMAFRLPLVKGLFEKLYQLEDPRLTRKLFGLTFKNPVGLAAGFDKNADYIHPFSSLGFGFLEIGTVTPKPQPGNPKPRLFRLPSDHALINRMGFNNEGMERVKENLKKRPRNIIIGGNIGKNKVTSNDQAAQDYIRCFDKLYPYVDYFVINVSSPNTPGLRDLQEKDPLETLIRTVQEANKKKPSSKPILLKIAPDLSDQQLDDVLEIVEVTKLDGLIATNTTIDREGLVTSNEELDSIGQGGLSGSPVFERSTEVVRYLRQRNQTIPIIAVGGISSGKDAVEKLQAGANLVQIYTGLVYRGPALIREICREILKH